MMFHLFIVVHPSHTRPFYNEIIDVDGKLNRKIPMTAAENDWIRPSQAEFRPSSFLLGEHCLPKIV
jgi:hypothetical protein